MFSFLLLVFSQDLVLPPEIKGEVGAFVTVMAQTKGKAVKFIALDAGLSVFPADLLVNPKCTFVVAIKPGRYRVIGYTSVNDLPSEPVFTVVVINDAVPPEPPKPPGPPDALFDSLVGIYGGSQDPQKQERVKQLAVVFRTSAAAASTYKTIGTLYAALRIATNNAMPADAVRAIRDRIAVELIRQLGENANAPLDAAKAETVFNKVAKVLEELAK